MGHLGDDRPKCLVELEGRPLHRATDCCAPARWGGRDRDRARLSRRDDRFSRRSPISTNDRWAETNMVMSIAAAALASLRAGHRQLCRHLLPQRTGARPGQCAGPAGDQLRSRMAHACGHGASADPLSDAETFRIDAEGQLLEIGGKTRRIDDIEGQYMGLLKFTPSAWSSLEALLETLDPAVRDRLDLTGLLRRLLEGKDDSYPHLRYRWPLGRNRQSRGRSALPEHG